MNFKKYEDIFLGQSKIIKAYAEGKFFSGTANVLTLVKDVNLFIIPNVNYSYITKNG